MSRRASLPGAAELFRSTGSSTPEADQVPASIAVPSPVETHLTTPPASVDTLPEPRSSAGSAVRRTSRRARPAADRLPTGRERHEEKITVYVSADELVDIETARLTLRAEHGLAVDRGRIVREAVAVVLADLEAKGESSILVRRLREI